MTAVSWFGILNLFWDQGANVLQASKVGDVQAVFKSGSVWLRLLGLHASPHRAFAGNQRYIPYHSSVAIALEFLSTGMSD